MKCPRCSCFIGGWCYTRYMYNIKTPEDKATLLRDAALFEHNPYIDAILDSMPEIVSHVEKLEEMIADLKTKLEKSNADLKDALRRNNNLNSQKVRHLKRKGKY